MSSSNANRAPVAQRRSPLVAVVLSGLFPGLGQLYNRQLVKAVLFFTAAALLGFGPFSPLVVDIDLGDLGGALTHLLLASLPFLLVALWSLIDAYNVARRSTGPTN